MSLNVHIKDLEQFHLEPQELSLQMIWVIMKQWNISFTWQVFWKSELLHLNNNIFSQYKQSKHSMPTLLTENLKQYRSWYWYLSSRTNLFNIRMHIMHHQKEDWLDGSAVTAVVGLDGGLVAAVVGLYGGLAVRPGGWFLTCFTRSRCQLQ